MRIRETAQHTGSSSSKVARVAAMASASSLRSGSHWGRLGLGTHSTGRRLRANPIAVQPSNNQASKWTTTSEIQNKDGAPRYSLSEARKKVL